jgi:hypothetical protein
MVISVVPGARTGQIAIGVESLFGNDIMHFRHNP